jgi:hypothetical protein
MDASIITVHVALPDALGRWWRACVADQLASALVIGDEQALVVIALRSILLSHSIRSNISGVEEAHGLDDAIRGGDIYRQGARSCNGCDAGEYKDAVEMYSRGVILIEELGGC